MKKHFVNALLMTIATTVLLGIAYPLAITGMAQLLLRDKANGQMVFRKGEAIGSRIIGQPFTGPGYFHSRPSAAGNGYDATNSGGSNLGPTNQKLIDRVHANSAQLHLENPGQPVPADLITTSASGLDPDISPEAAAFQIPRIAKERKLPEDSIRHVVARLAQPSQFGLLGEPRVNVLELNLALDDLQKH
jgi:potassium-transporting ATPase KdpC subunit